MVRPAGVEPARHVDTSPSSWRVYPFRHGRLNGWLSPCRRVRSSGFRPAKNRARVRNRCLLVPPAGRNQNGFRQGAASGSYREPASGRFAPAACDWCRRASAHAAATAGTAVGSMDAIDVRRIMAITGSARFDEARPRCRVFSGDHRERPFGSSYGPGRRFLKAGAAPRSWFRPGPPRGRDQSRAGAGASPVPCLRFQKVPGKVLVGVRGFEPPASTSRT